MIVVGLSYYTPHAHQDSKEEGKISRYAWGTDYHEILPMKMQEIVLVQEIGLYIATTISRMI